MKACHYIKHKGESILIPGCYATVIYGKSHCTCNHYKIEKDRISELEKRIISLECKLKTIK